MATNYIKRRLKEEQLTLLITGEPWKVFKLHSKHYIVYPDGRHECTTTTNDTTDLIDNTAYRGGSKKKGGKTKWKV